MKRLAIVLVMLMPTLAQAAATQLIIDSPEPTTLWMTRAYEGVNTPPATIQNCIEPDCIVPKPAGQCRHIIGSMQENGRALMFTNALECKADLETKWVRVCVLDICSKPLARDTIYIDEKRGARLKLTRPNDGALILTAEPKPAEPSWPVPH